MEEENLLLLLNSPNKTSASLLNIKTVCVYHFREVA